MVYGACVWRMAYGEWCMMYVYGACKCDVYGDVMWICAYVCEYAFVHVSYLNPSHTCMSGTGLATIVQYLSIICGDGYFSHLPNPRHPYPR